MIMPKNDYFPPEGLCPPDTPTLAQLQAALEEGTVLESPVLRCDVGHNLHLRLGGVSAVLPREEVTAPWISGANREISILSRVGKQICFTVKQLLTDEKGSTKAILSRKCVQEAAMDWYLDHLQPGDLLTCRVTRAESFGVFADIGRGVIAMLPLEYLSVSRLPHAGVRVREGQTILAAVASMDRESRRVTLTQKELLGTWLENTSRFSPGETVTGVVRSVKEYGSFIELAPNLSGLTDTKEGLSPGDRVSVYIKSIQPQRMKIKLHIIARLGRETEPAPLRYQITDGHLDRWVYSPPNYEKEPVETVFTAPCP